MTENRTIQLAAIPIGGKGGFVWNRLHGEREDLCEALLKYPESSVQPLQNQQLLQARLRRIDDALDRLMSGSYGICSKCGHAIEDTTLEIDPAWSLCLVCWTRDVGDTHLIRDDLNDSKPYSQTIVENFDFVT